MWPLAVAGAVVLLAGCRRAPKPEGKKTQKAEKKAEVPKKSDIPAKVKAANITSKSVAIKKIEAPIKWDLPVTVKTTDITSKSAVINYEISNIDFSKMGPENALLLILKVTGSDTEGSSQSLTRMRTSYSKNLAIKEEFSGEKIRDKNGKPFELLSDATYEVTLEYAVISRNENLNSFNKPGTVIANCTFKTPPDPSKNK